MRSLVRLLAAGFALASLAAAERNALANGRFPAASQLVVAPTDPSLLLLRTTYGVLVSHDTGGAWDWICERAIGYGGSEDPSLALTSSKRIVAGTYEGLALSPDTGCGWSFYGDALVKKVIADVVVRPDAPATAFALGSTYAGANDAGASLYENRLFGSTDDGASWAPFGAAIAPDVISETVEVAASDAQRIYVTAVRGAGATAQGLIFVSSDGGATWTERTVVGPSDTTSPDRLPYLSGVDPKNADRIYVRTDTGEATKPVSRLLVSDDAGQTFRVVFASKPLLGFALNEDGSRVFVGSKDGLFTASRDDLAFTQRSPIEIQCLKRAGARLYACSSEVSAHFIVGASDDDGSTFAPVLHLDTVRGPIACAPEAAAARCGADWPPVRDTLGIDAGSDAGDAGPSPGGDHGRCGCRVPGAPAGGTGALGAGAALALAAAAAVAARRRRRIIRSR